jgi:hypothetical protein
MPLSVKTLSGAEVGESTALIGRACLPIFFFKNNQLSLIFGARQVRLVTIPDRTNLFFPSLKTQYTFHRQDVDPYMEQTNRSLDLRERECVAGESRARESI